MASGKKSGKKASSKSANYPLKFSSGRDAVDFFNSDSDKSSFASADIYENKDSVFIDMEIPGINPDKISVTLKGNVVTIKGNRKEVTVSKDISYYCAERSFGQFKREFRIADTIDSNKLTASFKNGVLHITMPKVSNRRERDRRIKVEFDE